MVEVKEHIMNEIQEIKCAKEDPSFDEEIWINTVPTFYENQKEDLLLTDEGGIQWVALSKYADTGKGDLAYNKLLIWNWLYGYFVTDEQLVTLKKYADKKVNLINSDISWIPETYTIYNREYPWSSGSKSIEESQWENIKVETGEMKSIIEKVEEPQFSYAEILQKKYLGEFDEDKKWDELGTALDKEHGNQLFDKNIRYYKGSTEVNQGIKTVLKTEPEKFFYYNNGIKILCRKIIRKIVYSNERKTGLFKLEGVSLVNGAQTTGTIGGVFCENPELVSNAKVLIQMIDLGASGENQEVQEDQAIQITKLSNTQNRIEGKDFASLDPEQERLRMELSLGGIQYLYKDGSQIEDPEHQIVLDETIVSQACLLDEISIIALVKGNVGALTENIDKTPYKKLFNGSTNSFTMYNGVLVLRAVESYIKENESNVTGRKKLVLIHGNRFLLHLALREIKNMDNFDDQYLDQEELRSIVNPICEKYWDKVYEIIEQYFPDAYPAYLFKNVGRLKEIIEKIQENNV